MPSHHGLIHFHHLAGDDTPVVAKSAGLPGAGQLCARRWVLDESGKGGGKSVRVPHREEKAGWGVRFCVANGGESFNVAGNNSTPCSHCFHEDDAEGLPTGVRCDIDVRLPEDLRFLLLGDPSDEVDARKRAVGTSPR